MAVVPAGLRQCLEQAAFQGQAQLLVVSRVLGLGVDADHAALLQGLALDQGDDLLQRRHLELAVELLRALAEGLLGAQRLDLGEREVGGEETFFREAIDHHGAAARGELGALGHVGGVRDVGLVAGDQVAVLGGHEVRLDVVGPQLDGQRIGLQGVLGQVARGAAVADDQGPLGAVSVAAAELGVRQAVGLGSEAGRGDEQRCRQGQQRAKGVRHGVSSVWGTLRNLRDACSTIRGGRESRSARAQ